MATSKPSHAHKPASKTTHTDTVASSGAPIDRNELVETCVTALTEVQHLVKLLFSDKGDPEAGQVLIYGLEQFKQGIEKLRG